MVKARNTATNILPRSISCLSFCIQPLQSHISCTPFFGGFFRNPCDPRVFFYSHRWAKQRRLLCYELSAIFKWEGAKHQNFMTFARLQWNHIEWWVMMYLRLFKPWAKGWSRRSTIQRYWPSKPHSVYHWDVNIDENDNYIMITQVVQGYKAWIRWHPAKPHHTLIFL